MAKGKRIRYLKTSTGENFSITISKDSARQFSGCYFQETILSNGILLTSGCGIYKEMQIKKFEKINRW